MDFPTVEVVLPWYPIQNRVSGFEMFSLDSAVVVGNASGSAATSLHKVGRLWVSEFCEGSMDGTCFPGIVEKGSPAPDAVILHA